jgi:hypothetical protein
VTKVSDFGVPFARGRNVGDYVEALDAEHAMSVEHLFLSPKVCDVVHL